MPRHPVAVTMNSTYIHPLARSCPEPSTRKTPARMRLQQSAGGFGLYNAGLLAGLVSGRGGADFLPVPAHRQRKKAIPFPEHHSVLNKLLQQKSKLLFRAFR